MPPTPNPELEASNILYWILQNGFVNEYNKPLEFVKHRFLIDYMADNHPTIVSKKCAQVGMTVAEVLKSMHYAAYKKLNVIHTLQTSDVVDGFVFPKVNPIIEYNPKIKALMQNTDSKTLKRFGDNFVFYRGANAESQAINITGDVLCIDEYDRSNQNVVEIYQSRLDASEYKWKRYFSNPSAIGFGVDGLYNQSDQRHWFVKCSHCNHKSWLEFTQVEDSHFVDVTKGIYACGKCKGEIYTNDRINGTWVAKFPDKDWHGYWFSQLMAPWKLAEEIIEVQETSSIEYFHNFVLGKAFTPADLIVNRDTILRACKPALIPKVKVAIGVDNGIIKHWVAATPDGVFDYGKTENWGDIERLLLMYNATMVIDALPDFTIPKQLVQKYRGKVFINYYVPDTKNLGTVRWGKNEDWGVVKTDRTKLLDLCASEIASAKLLFRQHPRDLEGMISHWSNVFRTTVVDDKTGIERGSWTHQEHKPDHYCLAMGCKIQTSKGLVEIQNIKIGDMVLTRKGFKRVERAWMTKSSAKVYKYRFSNGSELIATPEHPIFVKEKGFIALQDITTYDKLVICPNLLRVLYFKVSLIAGTLTRKVGKPETITRQMVQRYEKGDRDFIEKFGELLTERYRKAMLSTTKTITPTTMIFQISDVYPTVNILSTMCETGTEIQATKNQWRSIFRKLKLVENTVTRNGWRLDKPKNNSKIRLSNTYFVRHLSGTCVSSAIKSAIRYLKTKLSIVASDVVIVSVEEDPKRQPVYNLTVEGEHEYYANGILVSNCHAYGYMRIALSRLLGGSFGMEFAEPAGLTRDRKVTDDVNSSGELVGIALPGGHTLGQNIEEALDTNIVTEDWKYS